MAHTRTSSTQAPAATTPQIIPMIAMVPRIGSDTGVGEAVEDVMVELVCDVLVVIAVEVGVVVVVVVLEVESTKSTKISANNRKNYLQNEFKVD